MQIKFLLFFQFETKQQKIKSKNLIKTRRIRIFFFRLRRVNLNCWTHFRWRINIWTSFKSFCCNIDFVIRSSNKIVTNSIVSRCVNETQTNLKVKTTFDRIQSSETKRTCFPNVKPNAHDVTKPQN